MAIKIILLVLFFAVMIGVGIYAKKHSTDVNGFVLGGRAVGPWLTAFAFGTSYFSAVIFVGYAGQFGWKYCIASTWIGLGNAFIGSLLAWVILGRRTRVMTQHLGSKTMPDFFELRYMSTPLKIAASIITFVFLIPYTASLFNGLSRLFSMAFPGIDYSVCVVVMAILTAIYVIVGGYMATAINDFIQGIIMLIGIVAVIIAVLKVNGGLTGSMIELSKMVAKTNIGNDFPGGFASFFGPQPIWLIGVVLLTSLGTWGLPQIKAVRKGTIISTVFAIVVAGGCYFLGGFGRLFVTGDQIDPATGNPVGGFDSIIPSMLETLSPVLIAIVLILVLSASMSTLSSLVLTSSSTITLDFIGQFAKMNEKKKMISLRIFVAFFIIVSAVIAIVQAKSNVTFIAQLMGVSWGALAGAFLAPFLYGLFMKKVTKAAVWVSFISGVGITGFELFVMVSKTTFQNPVLNYLFSTPINAGVLAMVAGLVLVPLVSLITPKLEKKKVDEIFACYDDKVTVEVTESLGD